MASTSASLSPPNAKTFTDACTVLSTPASTRACRVRDTQATAAGSDRRHLRPPRPVAPWGRSLGPISPIVRSLPFWRSILERPSRLIAWVGHPGCIWGLEVATAAVSDIFPVSRRRLSPWAAENQQREYDGRYALGHLDTRGRNR